MGDWRQGERSREWTDREVVLPLGYGREKGAEVSYSPGWIQLVREGSGDMLKGKGQGQWARWGLQVGWAVQ